MRKINLKVSFISLILLIALISIANLVSANAASKKIKVKTDTPQIVAEQCAKIVRIKSINGKYHAYLRLGVRFKMTKGVKKKGFYELSTPQGSKRGNISGKREYKYVYPSRAHDGYMQVHARIKAKAKNTRKYKYTWSDEAIAGVRLEAGERKFLVTSKSKVAAKLELLRRVGFPII